ncbi:GvpL/GvpF family gas vesicle protein [Candidatus Nitrosotalea okcheonensis]|uniref:Putative gas vesicle synthesis protein GvpL_GvpF n=1 Tax=Candidatus Nitrosotalea okcheonensis TaxID=1903276 RepID=A0A2H1FFD3_9ARCH|nr:GvpL/GvpF family gas vesicle protein [Candidatus Nitrosotalea okcheonensis]SMH71454.1 putative gas vesicle synthesis protein GvpL_GvpF [Candidatus Nitrosotalea okcheonensis]
MVDGKYLYCVKEGSKNHRFSDAGLFGKQAYIITYKDISAVVSNIPFKEMQPDVENLTAHQRVIEESRSLGTTLPVRFGIMFKTDDGVKKMLVKSYADLKSKIVKLRDKDEFGVKIIMDKSDLKKISLIQHDNQDIEKIKKEILLAGEGTSYFLKMKLDEAIKNQTYKKIDQISGQIHNEITKASEDKCLLKSDFDEIILNASYLVDRDQSTKFHQKIDNLKKKYESAGFIFHLSGPWAPYSFC